MLKRIPAVTMAALPLLLALPGGASAHMVSVTKAQPVAEAWTLETTRSMDMTYGGAETYAVANCAGKLRRGHRHKVTCDYEIVGRNDEIGKWMCVGKVHVVFKKKKSKKLKAVWGSMEHHDHLPEER